jgi:hypothetical protein
LPDSNTQERTEVSGREEGKKTLKQVTRDEVKRTTQTKSREKEISKKRKYINYKKIRI